MEQKLREEALWDNASFLMPLSLRGIHPEEESSQVPAFCREDQLKRQWVGWGEREQGTNNRLYLGPFLLSLKRAGSLKGNARTMDNLN